MIVIINPPLVSLRGDILGSGIPYIPVSMAYLAAYIRSKGHTIQVIDGFGSSPKKKSFSQTHLFQGLSVEEIVAEIPEHLTAIFLYAGNVISHTILLQIIRTIRKKYDEPIILFENTQAVTAYSLVRVANDFLDAGATIVLSGEAEARIDSLLKALKGELSLHEVDGATFRDAGKTITVPKKIFFDALDDLPFPAWDLLPMKNYWALGYSHGPLSSKTYLPILTSRGCPYGCKYCVVPETNSRRWRFRTAKNVVDEFEHNMKLFGVQEFHWEDLNPTIRKDRMIEISKEILNRKLNIQWKIVAGTKVETLDKDVISWMAKAGCTYISISPESGSPKVLKLMDKPFNHELAITLVNHMNTLHVAMQACFVLGFPGETSEDLQLTKKYVHKLARAGVDEIALFIMTPIPGSEQYLTVKGFPSLDQLTFSPSWRQDYIMLHKFRKVLYLQFHLLKMLYHPFKAVLQPVHIFRRKFVTKTEMAVYRYFQMYLQRGDAQ